MKANLSFVARRSEPIDSLDYFPTPPWATRAFMAEIRQVPEGLGWISDNDRVWEPACGEGHMAAVLAETNPVFASDIFPYGYGTKGDFLGFADDRLRGIGADWVITNPPFNVALRFIERAMLLAKTGVAVLVRLSFLEGGERSGRYEFFKANPPTGIFIHAGRVPMHKGRWEPNGSSATAYCWLVWRKNTRPIPPVWIRPDAKLVYSRRDDAARFGALGEAPLLDAEPYAPAGCELDRQKRIRAAITHPFHGDCDGGL